MRFYPIDSVILSKYLISNKFNCGMDLTDGIMSLNVVLEGFMFNKCNVQDSQEE